MGDITAAGLTAGNLLYRELALYDEFHADSTVAGAVVDAVVHSQTRVESVLDLGCGTGHVLAELHQRRGWSATGVDIQPAILDHARTNHLGLDFRIGDLRTVRLNARFDLLLCLGNTLSYLQNDSELAAAFDTMKAHSYPDSLIVISTLDTPGREVHSRSRVTSKAVGGAEVTTTTRWDGDAHLLITSRLWRLDGGRVEKDHIVRRVWPPDTVTHEAVRVGLRPPVFLRP